MGWKLEAVRKKKEERCIFRRLMSRNRAAVGVVLLEERARARGKRSVSGEEEMPRKKW
jgi:hypothetical protein